MKFAGDYYRKNEEKAGLAISFFCFLKRIDFLKSIKQMTGLCDMIFGLALFWVSAIVPAMYLVATPGRPLGRDWHSIQEQRNYIGEYLAHSCEHSSLYTGQCIQHDYVFIRAAIPLTGLCILIFTIYLIILSRQD